MSAVRSRALIGVMLVSVPMLVGAQKPPKPGGTPPNPAIAYEARNNSRYWDLMVMDADGRNQTRLLTGGDNLTPSWSPDGEWIAFARTSVTSPGIYMIRANGTGLCRITATHGNPYHAPSWSPSRASSNGLYRIVYADYVGQSVPDLFSVDARCGGSVPQNLTNTATIGEYTPAWSQDDVLAAAVGGTGNESDVHLFDIQTDGQGGISLAPRVNLSAAGPLAAAGLGSPSWTRDGNNLVVSASLPPFTDADLWVLSATGSGVATNLTDTPGVVEWRTTWSPDYRYLAFDRDRQVIYKAEVIEAEGTHSLGAPTVLARPPKGYTGVSHPSWRPVP